MSEFGRGLLIGIPLAGISGAIIGFVLSGILGESQIADLESENMRIRRIMERAR